MSPRTRRGTCRPDCPPASPGSARLRRSSSSPTPRLHHRRSTPSRLYILRWREHSCRKLSPTLATPTTLAVTTLVARCELSRRKIGLLLEVDGRKFSHIPGNSATVGVVRWPAAGDTAGSSLRRLSSLQHTIYNLLVLHTRYTHYTPVYEQPCSWLPTSHVAYNVGVTGIASDSHLVLRPLRLAILSACKWSH